MSKHPEVRIKNAWLIYHNVSVHLHRLFRRNKKIATLGEVDKKVASYQKAWKKRGAKILDGLHKITGLKFRQNVIDVYVAPGFNAFSDPMVIGIRYDPDYFVDVLTHELLHRLLTDNTKKIKSDLVSSWRKLFGQRHNFTTLVHIPVHAIHQAVFLDILKEPKRLEREIQSMKNLKTTDYMAAWDYVEKHGYKNIIKKLRAMYGT